jgi:hypothetical protein
MPLLEPHETLMMDLDYRIAEADKNCAMHSATAATLRSLKDLFERRIEDHRRAKAAEAKRVDAVLDGSPASGGAES